MTLFFPISSKYQWYSKKGDLVRSLYHNTTTGERKREGNKRTTMIILYNLTLNGTKQQKPWQEWSDTVSHHDTAVWIILRMVFILSIGLICVRIIIIIWQGHPYTRIYYTPGLNSYTTVCKCMTYKGYWSKNTSWLEKSWSGAFI